MVIEPVNFSRSQIESIAQKFAELTNFTPCVTDIEFQSWKNTGTVL